MSWRLAPFEELTPREVHDLYQARVAIFVVEQDCVFQDVDGLDPLCRHLLGYGDDGRTLVAYCRLVPPGVKHAEPSIGRVITVASVRGTGLGRALMGEALRHAEALWPGRAIRVAAQAHLERFYNGFGFVVASEPYDEDGIAHIDMLRAPSKFPDTGVRVAGQVEE